MLTETRRQKQWDKQKYIAYSNLLLLIRSTEKIDAF